MDESDFIQFVTIKKRLRAGSVKICRLKHSYFFRWLKEERLDLSKDSVEKFILHLHERKLKNNSINAYIFFLRYLQEYYVDRGLKIQFFDGLTSLPKNPTFIEVFTDEEIERLYTTSLTYGVFRGKSAQRMDSIYRCMTKFIAMTGCRFEEAQGLLIEHLDLVYGFATFVKTKNGQLRRIPLREPSLITDLKAVVIDRERSDYVFTNMMGNKIHHSIYLDDMIKRGKKAGIKKPLSPHKLRHSFASSLSDQMTPIEDVSKLLGHSDIQTTYSTYIHISDKRLQRSISRHPLINKSMNMQEKLKIVMETIESFRLSKEEVKELIRQLK
jgi:integrase/recombinase XerD